MSKFEEALARFKEEITQLDLSYHNGLFEAIAEYLGPSIHDKDASLVACSDESERTTIKENFLIGKLGMEDGPNLDSAIEQVCGLLGKDNTQKHRVTFYYLLVGLLRQEHQFISTKPVKEPR